MPVFLAEKEIPTLRHAPYSPDLALCDLPFPTLKSVPKGTPFRSTEVIRYKTSDGLKAVSQNNFGDVSRPERAVWSLVSFGLMLFWKGEYVNTKIKLIKNTFLKHVSLFNSHTL